MTSASAGATYPQTPGRISVGIFCPGCYGNASVQVGSALTGSPDNYVATLTGLEIVNYNPASQYTFRDMSGLADSVILTLPTSSSKLSGGVIAGIVVGGLVGIIIIVGLIEYCRRSWKTKETPVEHGEVQEVPGARTKFTEGHNRDDIATMGEPVMVALRYPDDGEVGGRLGQ